MRRQLDTTTNSEGVTAPGFFPSFRFTVKLREPAVIAIGETVDLSRREYWLNPEGAPFPLVVPVDPSALMGGTR